MKKLEMKVVTLAVTALLSSVACAEWMDREGGFKFSERLTLRPYVSVSASYDSNTSGRKSGEGDVVWAVNPGLTLTYKAETWSLALQGQYQVHAYTRNKNTNSGNENMHSVGETLNYNWSNALASERGWSLMLTETFQLVNCFDDIVDSTGHEYNRNRKEFTSAIALERRFTDRFHSTINAGYYWLDYDNNNSRTGNFGLYGWERVTAGMEVGYAPTPWTDFIIAGSYQDYRQSGRKPNSFNPAYTHSPSRGTESYSVQGGIGSKATDKITYRVLAGWSQYTYDNAGKSSNGFTYSITANYNISETWKTMLLATSFYQPTEREYASSQRVDALSWGLAHSLVQNKLHATFDISYRREGREYSATKSYDYDLDVLTFRVGLMYALNRFVGLFSNFEYRTQFAEEDKSARGNQYEYDRYRLTLGVRFAY